MNGGLSASTVPRREIGQAIKNLTDQEFSYENFWRLLAQPRCQWPGGWDSANYWAMKKLGVYDEWNQGREDHYHHTKIQKIKDDTCKSFVSTQVELIQVSFHEKRNARLAIELRDTDRPRAQASTAQRQDDIERKPKISKKVQDPQVDFSDSDVEVILTRVPGRKPLANYMGRVNAEANEVDLMKMALESSRKLG